MRIPFKQSSEYRKDPVTGVEYETNVVYGTCPNFPMSIYPTLHIRWDMVRYAWRPAPEGYHWRHYVGPLAAIVSCIGLPGDFLVDTCFLYNDWDASETAKCPICDDRGCWNDPVPEDAPVDGVLIRVNGTRVK